MEIEPEILWKEIEEKLDALSEKVNGEFEQTEEYKVKAKYDSIIRKYQIDRHKFVEEYEVGEQECDKCYDVFGALRNPAYLKNIKSEYKTRKAYEERSRSNQQDYYSNYKSYTGGSSEGTTLRGNYSDKEKGYLKKFYRLLASKYHPDVTGETEIMQLINKLKEEWNV